MKEYLVNAREELKRVDHLIYVSLKYTRTVDVIRSVLTRMIAAIDCIIDGLVDKAKQEGKTESIPTQQGLRVDLVRDIYKNDEKLSEMMNFYLSLKKIMRAPYTKNQEFRRHVKMTSTVDDKEEIVNIDVVYVHFEKIKEFVNYIEEKHVLDGPKE